MTAFFRLFAALAALSIGSALAAQVRCPRQVARSIPHSETIGLRVTCGTGLQVEFGGIKVNTGKTECPLWVLFTPDYEVPQSASSETKTWTYTKVEAWLLQFQCETDYFLFFSTGSSCVHAGRFAAASYDRMVTLDC